MAKSSTRAMLRNLLTGLVVVGGLCFLIFLFSHVEWSSSPSGPLPSDTVSTPSEGAGDVPGCDENTIEFPRKNIVECEGYWRQLKVPKGIHAEEERRFPWPETHEHPFCGQSEWLRRLSIIEGAAEEAAPGGESSLRMQRFRGMSRSRIDDSFLGNKEYVDHITLPGASERDVNERRRGTYCWSGDFGTHYVKGHNVRPSQEFYHYVHKRYAMLKDAEAAARNHVV